MAEAPTIAVCLGHRRAAILLAIGLAILLSIRQWPRPQRGFTEVVRAAIVRRARTEALFVRAELEFGI